jgi:hypothetical protein
MPTVWVLLKLHSAFHIHGLTRRASAAHACAMLLTSPSRAGSTLLFISTIAVVKAIVRRVL